MATRREVDLVIKAKDQTTQVADAITAALENLGKSLSNMSKGGKKADDVLGGLAAAVSGLDKVMKTASGADRLATEMDRATKAADALNLKLETTEKELSDLKTKQAATAQSTAKLAAEQGKLEKAFAKESATLAKSTKAQKDRVTALTQAEGALKKASNAEGSLTSSIAKQEAKVAEVTAKLAAYQNVLETATKPTKQMQADIARTVKSLDTQNKKLDEMKSKLAGAQQEVVDATGDISRLAAEIEKNAQKIAKQNSAVSGTKAALAGMRTQVRAVASEEKALATAIASTEQSLNNQQEEAKQTTEAMRGLVLASVDAGMAMDQIARTAGRALTLAFAAQRREMLETKREWASSQATLKTLAAGLHEVGPPTREMAEAFEKARAEARQNKTEYDILKVGLHQLSGVLKETATDLNGIRAQQEAFAAVQGETAAKLNQSRQAAAENAAANAKLSAEARKAATSIRDVNQETAKTKSTTDAAAASTNKWAAAYRALYGESRTAMSWTQRLRGEVISLIAAYGGIFGAIEGLRGVVEATTKWEAAQTRLNALYSGDQLKAGADLDFIRRTANRLGIDIGELADEYTKFAAATKGTVIQGQATRDIFLKVAEAGRVNNLSMADMSGIFKALIQIASKGKVQLEELSGQLGDRLPGALQIMADGLGITVEELLKMTKEGEVASSSLVNFANELEKRYGAALPAALKSTSAILGQFQNAVTAAMLEFGKSGFMEGFLQLLNDITETLKSADFKAFAANISAALGLLAKALGIIVQNFKLVTIAVTGFLALKITPFVIAAASSLGKFATALGLTAVEAKAADTALKATAATAGVTTRAFAGLRAMLAGLLSSTGVGLALVAVSTAISYWATSADTATEAMTAHQKIVDAVKDAYDAAGGAVENWADKIKKTTLLEATANLTKLKQGAKEVREEMAATAVGTGLAHSEGVTRVIAEQLRDLQKEFVKTGGDVDAYRKKIEELANRTDDEGIKAYATALLEAANGMRETEEAVKVGEAIIRVLNKTATEADMALLGLTNAAKETAEGFKIGEKAGSEYLDKLNEIKGFIPGLTKELEKMKEMAKLDQLIADLMKMGPLTQQQMQLINQARSSINAKYTDYGAKYAADRFTTKGEEQGAIVSEATKLAAQLNVSVKDLLTLIHYESGFDSQVMSPMRKGKDYFGLFQASPDVRNQYGIGPGSSVKDQIEALGKYLVDRGVKPGDGLLPMYAAVNAGNAKNINLSDAANGGRPGDVQWKVENDMEGSKKAAEGLLEAWQGVSDEVKETAETNEKNSEKEKEMTTERQNALKLAEVENQFKDADLVTRTAELEIEKERQKLAAIGKTLSAEEEAAIRRRVELQEREKSNQEIVNNQKKAAEDTEARFTALIQQREALMKQAEALRAGGNTAGAEQAVAQARSLQSAIDQAAAAAVNMWQKIGGPEASAAIAKIQQAAAESKNLASSGNAVAAMWQQTGTIIGDNLVNAFDEFAQAVANGENAWKALGRAITKAAAQILIDIGKMIIRQAIFNALSGVFGLQPGANGLFHSGTGSGTFGSQRSNRTKEVSPMVWANAPRFHKGYQPGLGANEMAAIVEKDEAIMTEDSAFHPKNQAATLASAMQAGGGGKVNVKVVNAIDSGDFVAEGMNTSRGEQSVMNMMRKNKSSLKEILS